MALDSTDLSQFFPSEVGSKLGRVRANRMEFICGAFSWPLIDLCHFVSFVRRTPSTSRDDGIPGWLAAHHPSSDPGA